MSTKVDRLAPGARFGEWEVKGPAVVGPPSYLPRVPCLCHGCGRVCLVQRNNLYAGISTRCRWCAGKVPILRVDGPLGTFSSIRAAAEAAGVSPGGMRAWIRYGRGGRKGRPGVFEWTAVRDEGEERP